MYPPPTHVAENKRNERFIFVLEYQFTINLLYVIDRIRCLKKTEWRSDKGKFQGIFGCSSKLHPKLYLNIHVASSDLLSA